MESKYTKVNGKQIHYTCQGSGTAVVLIHGLMESAWVWEEMLCQWSKKYKVLCVDLPGHGQSEVLSDVHTMDICSDTIAAVMDNESIEKAVLIGHSMGGYVALSFAKRFHKRVLGLGLFHSHAGADTEEARAERLKVVELIKKNGEEKRGFITRFMPSLFYSQNVERLQPKIDILVETAKKMSSDAIIAIQKGLADRYSYFQVLQEYDKYVFPFLFVIGKHDKKTPIAKVVAQAMMCNRAEVLWLPCGHMGFWEETETCQSFIEGFISRVCGE